MSVDGGPPNIEMQLTRSACERSQRPLQLISVLDRPVAKDDGPELP
jgi:hypothetical protein